MDPDVVVSTGPFRNIGLSKAALTHRLRKLRAPSKCRECDSYVYFQGAECEEVSSSFHLATMHPVTIITHLFEAHSVQNAETAKRSSQDSANHPLSMLVAIIKKHLT